MRFIESGLVFPQSMLSSTWFLVLAVIVAFNTIIYLGLTLAKFLPWPAQIHPRQVRHLVPRTPNKDGASMSHAVAVSGASESPFLRLRLQAAQETIPQALALVGGLMIIISLANALLDISDHLVSHAISVAIALSMLVLAMVLGRGHASPRVMVWVWTFITSVFVAKVASDAIVSDGPLNLTYAIVVMVAAPAITMMWSASLTGSAANLIIFAAAAFVVDDVSTIPVLVAAVTGVLTGLILLQVRLNWVDELTREQIRSHELTTTDPATGLLSRTGLSLLAPGLFATGERAHDQVHAALVDIDGMGQVNADYGLEYGDSVVRAVARAVTASVPRGDLVARWDGDGFAVLGIGSSPDRDELRLRIDAAIAHTGVALGKRAITVSVGVAAVRPTERALDELAEAVGRDLQAQG